MTSGKAISPCSTALMIDGPLTWRLGAPPWAGAPFHQQPDSINNRDDGYVFGCPIPNCQRGREFEFALDADADISAPGPCCPAPIVRTSRLPRAFVRWRSSRNCWCANISAGRDSGCYGDALYRWNMTTENDNYIVAVGLFQQIKGWELDAGYRHLQTTRGGSIYFTTPDDLSSIVYPQACPGNQRCVSGGLQLHYFQDAIGDTASIPAQCSTATTRITSSGLGLRLTSPSAGSAESKSLPGERG